MNRKPIAVLSILTVLSLLLAACQATTPPPQVVEVTRIVEVTVPAPAGTPQVQVRVVEPTGGTLDKVKNRGKLVCGVHGTFNGFGFLAPDGKWSGFDVDFCRAWAAALFDDPNAVEFRPLSASERFTAVQTGEVDVLSRNSTKTLARETELKLDFGPVVFYDGQAMLVHKEVTEDPKAGLDVLEGGSVCVQTGTTTELNLTDQMRAAGVNYTPVVFDDQNAAFQAYDQGRCDGITSDRSQLATQGRAVLQDYSQHTLLDVVMSKEPLAPATLHGDDQWSDFVSWVVYGMVTAEEAGITSQNVDTFMDSQDPTVRRLLGVEGDMGTKLGVTNDFMVRVIKHVGNYGEVFDRNLGPDTPFNLARGQNALWTQGGLLYAPPFR
jgi:general L-amino acid transport system substrate-binding protein